VPALRPVIFSAAPSAPPQVLLDDVRQGTPQRGDCLMLSGLLIRVALVSMLTIAILGAAGVALMFGAKHAGCVGCVLLMLYVLLEIGLAMRRLERWIGT
jgi:hypothetical protein